MCGLIGPNGAGKTTLFNCVSRLVDPVAGSIRFDDTELLERKPHEIAALGIARTFQHLALVPSLSVRENVMLGAHYRGRSGFAPPRCTCRWCAARSARWPTTPTRRCTGSGSPSSPTGRVQGLAYGQLKRVELARAICERPRLLALDEPASGLSHGEVDELAALLKQLGTELGLTLLIVEHHMGLVMKVCDQIVVLDFGQVIAAGSPAEIQRNDRVIEAYLGAAA